MEIRKNWYEAAKVRISRRAYSEKTFDRETIKKIINFANEINNMNNGIRIEIVNKGTKNIFTGLIGGYGKISETNYYAAFIGNIETEHVEEKIGYFGEAFVLEATVNNIGTCWVSGTFSRENAEKDIKLGENEKIYAITPLGAAEENFKFKEKIIQTLVRSKNRKPLSKIYDGDVNDLSDWEFHALETVRNAPSARNTQPWVFGKTNSAVTLKNAKLTKSSLIDCGIAMLHFEIGALSRGVSGTWEYLSAPFVSCFNYVE